ncbi:hypothetical protein GIB67_036687 [Kingdonia uniflora]|uniref:Uncharacterized protein n=1 Tax=Kingdonia uniflora TaxID=39325 RepID=A0A7J7LWP0_9MAGN|nr:hypothetical protein GIB67_036687 [Kingdonia uniflora]
MELEDHLNCRHLKKLNLNAPILSTKRVSNLLCAKNSLTSGQLSSFDATERVPFAWEQVPGTPKGVTRRGNHVDILPPPKLPPCKWYPPRETSDVCNSSRGTLDCDDGFSDAFDMFSLPESLDDVNGASKLRADKSKHVSPSFIIRRFLPDANALAFSTRDLPLQVECASSSSDSRSVTPPKACGIGFFTWRMKHRLCGLKNPVRSQGHNKLRMQYSAAEPTISPMARA